MSSFLYRHPDGAITELVERRELERVRAEYQEDDMTNEKLIGIVAMAVSTAIVLLVIAAWLRS